QLLFESGGDRHAEGGRDSLRDSAAQARRRPGLEIAVALQATQPMACATDEKAGGARDRLGVTDETETRMTNIGRRHFLGGALAGGLACLAASGSQGAGAGARIEVLLDESAGTISPDIYGHFVEHLGGVVYDGVWVGT